MARRRHARDFLSYQADLLERISEAYEELAPEFEDRSRALRECLRTVRGRAGELLRLRYEESLKPDSIAARVGMAVVAVRVMLSRTRAALRGCIERKLKVPKTPLRSLRLPVRTGPRPRPDGMLESWQQGFCFGNFLKHGAHKWALARRVFVVHKTFKSNTTSCSTPRLTPRC